MLFFFLFFWVFERLIGFDTETENKHQDQDQNTDSKTVIASPRPEMHDKDQNGT